MQVWGDIEVKVIEGSATPGCEETKTCYDPFEVKPGIGGTVMWINDDTAAHTVTSGSAQDGPDGVFDSGLFLAGETFSHTFDTIGNYPYFCIVHPWMEGNVLVTPIESGIAVDLGTITMKESDDVVVTSVSQDGSVRVEITTTKPLADESLNFQVLFRDGETLGLKNHVNYDFSLIQNNKVILEETKLYSSDGQSDHLSPVLSSDDPVDIQINLLGFGLPNDEDNWTGPMGEMVYFQVVPEFGAISIIILGVSVMGILLLTLKTPIFSKNTF